MSVHVDPTWCKQEAVGIDDAMGMRGVDRARFRDFENLAIDKGDIGLPCRSTAAIDESGSGDYGFFLCSRPHGGKSNYLLDATITQNADAL